MNKQDAFKAWRREAEKFNRRWEFDVTRYKRQGNCTWTVGTEHKGLYLRITADAHASFGSIENMTLVPAYSKQYEKRQDAIDDMLIGLGVIEWANAIYQAQTKVTQ